MKIYQAFLGGGSKDKWREPGGLVVCDLAYSIKILMEAGCRYVLKQIRGSPCNRVIEEIGPP